jgi:hypothetical protein
MRQRRGGSSSIGGFRPLYYMVKVSLALMMNALKEQPGFATERREGP